MLYVAVLKRLSTCEHPADTKNGCPSPMSGCRQIQSRHVAAPRSNTICRTLSIHPEAGSTQSRSWSLRWRNQRAAICSESSVRMTAPQTAAYQRERDGERKRDRETERHRDRVMEHTPVATCFMLTMMANMSPGSSQLKTMLNKTSSAAWSKKELP